MATDSLDSIINHAAVVSRATHDEMLRQLADLVSHLAEHVKELGERDTERREGVEQPSPSEASASG
jgi:hypothetical protein